MGLTLALDAVGVHAAGELGSGLTAPQRSGPSRAGLRSHPRCYNPPRPGAREPAGRRPSSAWTLCSAFWTIPWCPGHWASPFSSSSTGASPPVPGSGSPARASPVTTWSPGCSGPAGPRGRSRRPSTASRSRTTTWPPARCWRRRAGWRRPPRPTSRARSTLRPRPASRGWAAPSAPPSCICRPATTRRGRRCSRRPASPPARPRSSWRRATTSRPPASSGSPASGAPRPSSTRRAATPCAPPRRGRSTASR